jgi:hypothetical protein
MHEGASLRVAKAAGKSHAISKQSLHNEVKSDSQASNDLKALLRPAQLLELFNPSLGSFNQTRMPKQNRLDNTEDTQFRPRKGSEDLNLLNAQIKSGPNS